MKKNTRPEILVRRIICELGYANRYRLHISNLPGSPDIVFREARKVIFVNGCYWHRHSRPSCQSGSRFPSKNQEYWAEVFDKNVRRDLSNQEKLLKQGWQILNIWECDLTDKKLITAILKLFLQS